MPLFRPEDKKLFRQIGYLSTAGLELAVSIAVGAIGGLLLDNWLGTKPLLTLVGLVFGAIAGFRGLYRTTRKAMNEAKDDKKDE
jgi:ATP synthase protein I